MSKQADKWLVWVDGFNGPVFFGAFATEDDAWDAMAEEGVHHDDVSDNMWLSEMDAEEREEWENEPLGVR